MIEGLKPYREMKDSDLPWVGSVPSRWNFDRAKVLFAKMNRQVEPNDGVVTCFRDGVVTLRSRRRLRGFTEALKEIGYQRVLRGDLVIHAMDAFAGAIGVSDSDGKSSPVYAVCRPRGAANSHYYARLIREMARTQWVMALAKGIRERSTDFRFETFANQNVPVPPPDEQAAIVGFLAHADRRIACYIRAKQKLIKLLEEQKQTIVHRAVTRGLDPNVRMKASGVAWLGEVPAHWEVVRLKTLVTRVTSGSRGWSNFAADFGPLFIRIGNLTRASVDLDLSDVIRLSLPPEALSEGVRTRLRPNDLLLSITAYIGSVAVVPGGIEEAYVSQHVACCTPRPDTVNPRWLAYVLLSPVGQTHGNLSMNGGTKQGLSLDDVRNYVVLLPPRPEQDELVVRIERDALLVDRNLAATRREITLLREFRTRLIADVVTGKLDVRAAAAGLPEVESDGEPDVAEDADEGPDEDSEPEEDAA